MAMIEKIKRLWGKAFVGGEWKVAYRPRNGQDGHYQIVDTPKGTWAADPFLYEVNGEHYLFVELYEEKKNKACIAYYKYIDGVPCFQGKIIEQPYHMSYPCVFEYNGEHYMIPETSANGTIDLYKAVEFPNKWEYWKCLFSGVKYADTTVLKWNDVYYTVSYRRLQEGWNLDIFNLDMAKLNMSIVTSKYYAANRCRPAGNFSVGEELIRPAQDCSNRYGESLILYKIECFDDGKFEESEKERIVARDISMTAVPDRIHTYNRDSKYECIDVFFENFDLFHGVRILWRAYLRGYLSKLLCR